MSKGLCILVSLALVFISAIRCDFFSTPSSQILYEGERTTLVCHVEGNAFWQINGTIYSELNAAFFEGRGITSFDFFVGDSGLNKTLTIVGSVLSNNNTVIRCISVQQNGITNASDDATITVLGPPSNVTLHELNSTAVRITWSESFVPPTVTLERYSVTVFNTSEPNDHRLIKTVTEVEPPTTGSLYSQTFSFDQGLTQCTQITFSVTLTSSIGTSPASNVSWEMPLYIGRDDSELKDSLSCLGSLNSKTLMVSFKPHKLCAFQSANYHVSVTKNGRSVTSALGSFSGGQQQKKIMQIPFPDQNVQAEHTAHVSVTSQYGSEQASVKCYLKDNPSVPSIGGLDGAASESGGVSVGFIAGVVISSIVVLLAIIVIIGVAVYLIRKQSVYAKHNHKPL